VQWDGPGTEAGIEVVVELVISSAPNYGDSMPENVNSV
jgi:hypothetical protein